MRLSSGFFLATTKRRFHLIIFSVSQKIIAGFSHVLEGKDRVTGRQVVANGESAGGAVESSFARPSFATR